jgi:hypothetical protein
MTETEGFTETIEDVREADFRLASRSTPQVARSADDVGCEPVQELVRGSETGPSVMTRLFSVALNTEEGAAGATQTATLGFDTPIESRDQFETILAQIPLKTAVLHRPEGKTNQHH